MQYHIRIKGHLDVAWQGWFAPLEIAHEPTGTTTLSGTLPDQAALNGVLLKINRLGLVLLAVESSEAQPEARAALENT
ncbi:MAG: hypothetical protein H0X37_09935 [Herpetosiphonaceae bacterium]|nr:hypothetical protein [Herpetosiphonaceae bacterium]